MSSHIIPESANNGLFCHSGASNSHLTELERTPGEAAVSQQTEEDGRDMAAPPAVSSPNSSGAAVTNSLPNVFSTQASNNSTSSYIYNSPYSVLSQANDYSNHRRLLEQYASVIVGGRRLKMLLNPTHSYYANERGEIRGFQGYQHKTSGTVYAYPVVKASKGNPFRKSVLARSHTGRLVGELESFRNSQNLKDFRICDLTLTLPDDLSEHLVKKSNGRSLVWSVFKRFLAELPRLLGLPDGSGLAVRANLHLWSSENPLVPHVHFHMLILNYYVTSENKIVKWFGQGQALKHYTVKLTDGTKESHFGYVPFSDDELESVKQLWTNEVKASRWGFKAKYLMDSKHKLEAYVGFLTWNEDNMPKIFEKIGYNNRSWHEDYAKYSSVHTDCANPPAWLEGYSNRPRVFGLWLRLAEFGGVEVKMSAKDLERISPLTGKPYEIKLERMLPANYLLDYMSSLAWFDFEKDPKTKRKKMIVRALDDAEKDWLLVACGLSTDDLEALEG